MKIQFYGRLADLFGREQDFAFDRPCTVAELRARLAAEHPGSAEALANKRVRACVDDRMVGDGHVIGPGQTIALLAPVSGG